jgi:signal transduction histidine kinase
VILEVRDYGRGIPEKRLSQMSRLLQNSGVGLAGMRERLNELRGGLEIETADPGTRVRAIIPLFPELRQFPRDSFVAGGQLPVAPSNPPAHRQAI